MCLLLHQRRWWAPARGNEATPTTLSTMLNASTAGCLQAGVPRVVALFGVQGWRWDWAREVRALVVALDAAAAGQQ